GSQERARRAHCPSSGNPIRRWAEAAAAPRRLFRLRWRGLPKRARSASGRVSGDRTCDAGLSESQFNPVPELRHPHDFDQRMEQLRSLGDAAEVSARNRVRSRLLVASLDWPVTSAIDICATRMQMERKRSGTEASPRFGSKNGAISIA